MMNVSYHREMNANEILNKCLKDYVHCFTADKEKFWHNSYIC
jgi:hypothetical protein